MKFVIQFRNANAAGTRRVWRTPRFGARRFDTRAQAQAYLDARLAEDDRNVDVYGPGAARIVEEQGA